MKKIEMAIVAGIIMIVLSSCGQVKNPEDTQTNVKNSVTEISDGTSEISQAQNGDTVSLADSNLVESLKEELENLIGEYDYLSDYGMGKLIIEKTAYGYDVSDYESESSYRFLADSSNIETIENNKIYIKYPEQVFSDGTVSFSYYILEYSIDEINVYYKKSVLEEAQFLYCATKKNDKDIDSGYFD